MSNQQFLGQLQLVAFGFAPKGWALCNGQLLSIQQNTALFSLLGTNFGGNGQTTFGLPNLQGRTPVGVGGDAMQLGQTGGQETHTLVGQEVLPHSHGIQAVTAAASQGVPNGNLLATTVAAATIYAAANASPAPLNNGSISTVGGQPHENRQPYLVMYWCISLVGIFPSRD